MQVPSMLFFPKVILYTFFSFLLIYGGLVLGSWIGLLGLGFSADGVWGPGVWVFWGFLGWGSLYKHRRVTLRTPTKTKSWPNHLIYLIMPQVYTTAHCNKQFLTLLRKFAVKVSSKDGDLCMWWQQSSRTCN